MEEKERRLKIKKIEKYNEIVSEEQRKIVSNTVLMASWAAVGAVAAAMNVYPPNFPEQTLKVLETGFDIVVFGAGVGGASYHLSRLIKSIIKKTSYEKKVDDLNTELDFDEEEKSRGAK